MMRVFVLAVIAALVLASPALGQQVDRAQDVDRQVQRPSEVTIFFHTGDTYGQGVPLGAYPVDGMAPDHLMGARFVDIRVCTMPHVFAVEQFAAGGKTIGTTTVRVRTGPMALSDVVEALDDACTEGHISVTAYQLGANMVPVAAVTPAPAEE